jgi:hypothetical protein
MLEALLADLAARNSHRPALTDVARLSRRMICDALSAHIATPWRRRLLGVRQPLARRTSPAG